MDMNQTLQGREGILRHEEAQLRTTERKSAEGKWTIMQALEHLYLMERASAAGLAQALSREADNPTEPKPYRHRKSYPHPCSA